MIEPIWLLLGLLLPMMIGAAAAWLFVNDRGQTKRPLHPLGWALGIGIASALGMLAQFGLPPWKSIEAKHSLLFAVLPAAVLVSLANAIPKMPAAVLWLLRLGVVALTVYMVLQSQLTRWSTQEQVLWLGGIGAAMLISWILIHAYAHQPDHAPALHTPRRRSSLFILGATAGAIGATTIASGSITTGQLAASLAIAIAGAWLATLKRTTTPAFTLGMVDVILPTSFGFLIYSWYFAWQMQHTASTHVVAVLFVLAPLGLWMSSIPPFKSRPPRQRTVISLAASFILIAAAVGLAAYEAMLRSQQDTGPSYY